MYAISTPLYLMMSLHLISLPFFPREGRVSLHRARPRFPIEHFNLRHMKRSNLPFDLFLKNRSELFFPSSLPFLGLSEVSFLLCNFHHSYLIFKKTSSTQFSRFDLQIFWGDDGEKIILRGGRERERDKRQKEKEKERIKGVNGR